MSTKVGHPKLAAIGKSVRKRLIRHDRVEVVEGGGVTLYLFRNFLTAEECARLVVIIDATARPSTLYKGTEVDGYRTSYSGDVDPWDPFIRQIEGRICLLMGIDSRHGETIQGQRYNVGQVFKPHQDYFHRNTDYWEQERTRGGQRSWTAMIYLNRPEGGGETNFPKAGLCLSPETALLVLWNNMDDAGNPQPKTLHEGVAVTAGTKYIITKWFRERFWTS